MSETPRTWQELYGENDVGHFRRSVEMTKGEFAAADRWWSDCVRRGNEEKYAAEYIAWRELAAALSERDALRAEIAEALQISECGDLRALANDCARARLNEDALRAVLKALLHDAPIVECNDFHHYKADLNHKFDQCPPFNRWNDAVGKARALIAAPRSAK